MSINYKSKNDISYFKFKEFSKDIEGRSNEFINYETKRVFNPKSLEGFSEALKINNLRRLRYKLKLDFKNIGEFIDADTFYTENEYINFFKSVLKRRYFFKRINFEEITLAEAEYILFKFAELKNNLINEYEYLYNPPIRVTSSDMTAGGIERQSFAEHYGPYIELIYLVCKGDFTKYEEVVKWDLHRFLFQAEYLKRKKDVENLK